MIEMPYISPKFTIDDIHRIREYNSEVTKNMTVEEKCEYFNSRGKEVQRKIEELKKTKGHAK